MAGLQAVASTEGEVACVAATPKTVIRVKTPASQRGKLLGWAVSFDGVSPTAEPVQVRVIRQTTDGTLTSVTPKKMSDYTESVQTTAGKDATVEPTAGDELDAMEVHPMSGFARDWPYGQEPQVPGGGRVGIEVTAPANVNCRALLRFEE